MSAYKFTPEQIESLKNEARARLEKIGGDPHQRMGYPSRVKGQDVTVNELTLNATLESFKIGKN